jgi:hypothetical protein
VQKGVKDLQLLKVRVRVLVLGGFDGGGGMAGVFFGAGVDGSYADRRLLLGYSARRSSASFIRAIGLWWRGGYRYVALLLRSLPLAKGGG